MHQSPRVLLRIASHRDVEAMRLRLSGWNIDVHLTEASFLAALRKEGNPIIVREFSAKVGYSPSMLKEFVALAADKPLIIRAELRPTFVREVLAVISGAQNVRLSLIGYDALTTELLSCQATIDQLCADRPILAKLASRLDPRIREIVVGAVAGSKRRIDVPNLARVCGHSVRKLEWCLHRSGAPTPERVIGWATSLHILWRIETTNTPVKLAAREAGFPDASALGNYIFRHAGVRTTAAVKHVGFWALLERFASQFG